MKRWIIATSNPGKIREIGAALQLPDVQLRPQSEFNIADADETGLTFIENALLKARHAARHTGLPALADDSGLCVAALQGAPGLISARYAGEKASASQNIAKLLAAMSGVTDRRAYFYSIVVLVRHAEDPCPIMAEGAWHGEISLAPRGDDGFGYDPVFFDPVSNASAAELDLTVKNQISHRGQALVELKRKLLQSGY